MERYKKVIFCSLLNKDVHTTYFIQNHTSGNGNIISKTVQFYNCASKEECTESGKAYHILDCPSFKETRRVELEINSLSP